MKASSLQISQTIVHHSIAWAIDTLMINAIQIPFGLIAPEMAMGNLN
jgi:hypothetical protein